MLPVVLSTETLSNARFSASLALSGQTLTGGVSENFTIFVDITPAFLSGISGALSPGDFTVAGAIRPRISGVQINGQLGEVFGTVYFGATTNIFGIAADVFPGFLDVQGELRGAQAYPQGLYLEMRTGALSVYLDQWTPVDVSTTNTWEDINIEDAFCEV